MTMMMTRHIVLTNHASLTIATHKMIITNSKTLNGTVIITIMGDPHTGQEDIVLKVEILIIDHAKSKTTDISMLHPQEVILGRDLVEVHGEVDPILDEHMVEVNLPIKMTTAYLV